MAQEISFYVLPGGSRVSLEVEESAVCSEVVQELLYYLQIPPEGKGAWHLTETWRGCGTSCIKSQSCVVLAILPFV